MQCVLSKLNELNSLYNEEFAGGNIYTSLTIDPFGLLWHLRLCHHCKLCYHGDFCVDHLQ